MVATGFFVIRWDQALFQRGSSAPAAGAGCGNDPGTAGKPPVIRGAGATLVQ